MMFIIIGLVLLIGGAASPAAPPANTAPQANELPDASEPTLG
jgi:hypothetical protein